MISAVRLVLSAALTALLVIPRAEAAASLEGEPPGAPAVSRESVIPFLNEASVQIGKGDLPAASATLQKALSALPGDPGVTFNLAQVEIRLGHKAEAFGLLWQLADRGLGFHPDADPAFRSLSDLPGYGMLLEQFDRRDPVVTSGQRAFVLPERDLFPEGMACDASTGTLYVGSILKRKIVRIGPDGVAADFTSPGQDGIWGVLGLKVDPPRGELWAASTAGPELPQEEGRSGLFRFDLRTGRLVGKYVLPAGLPHILNDLAIAPEGNVYVTDTAEGAVYRASIAGTELDVFLPAGTFRSPNGVALSDDGKRLYVASSGRGISAVEIASRVITDVAAPKDVLTLGIDGLYTFNGSLIGVQNGLGRGRVMRYSLASPAVIRGSEIIESRNPIFQVPTTGAICGSDFFYLANTQIDKVDEKGRLTPDGAMKEIVILKVRLRTG